MYITSDLLDVLIEDVGDKLRLIGDESGFVLESLYPELINHINSNYQEIEIQVEFRNSNGPESMHYCYSRKLKAKDIPDLEQSLFDDLLEMMKP